MVAFQSSILSRIFRDRARFCRADTNHFFLLYCATVCTGFINSARRSQSRRTARPRAYRVGATVDGVLPESHAARPIGAR